MRSVLLAAGTLCITVLLAACAPTTKTNDPNAAATERLRNDMRVLTAAAARHDTTGAQAALASLNADAAAAAAAGTLSDTKLTEIRLASVKVQADLMPVTSRTPAVVASHSSSAAATPVPVVSPATTSQPSVSHAPTYAPTTIQSVGAPKPTKPGKGHKPPKR